MQNKVTNLGFALVVPLGDPSTFSFRAGLRSPLTPEAPKWWIRWACPRAIFFLVLVLSNEV